MAAVDTGTGFRGVSLSLLTLGLDSGRREDSLKEYGLDGDSDGDDIFMKISMIAEMESGSDTSISWELTRELD